MLDYSETERIILSCGAFKAERIGIEDVVLNRGFFAMCEENRCGLFDRCYMCPPCIGNIDDLILKVRSYSGGILYQTVLGLDNPTDIEEMLSKTKVHMDISQKIQRMIADAGAEDFLHLSTGGCGLCDICARVTDEPCRYPDKAMSSLEAYGIDVCKTASATSLKYDNGYGTVTFFGIILAKDIQGCIPQSGAADN